jgi:hypothetical protein
MFHVEDVLDQLLHSKFACHQPQAEKASCWKNTDQIILSKIHTAVKIVLKNTFTTKTFHGIVGWYWMQ